MQFRGDADFGIPTIAIVYSVLGDAVTIKRVLVSIE